MQGKKQPYSIYGSLNLPVPVSLSPEDTKESLIKGLGEAFMKNMTGKPVPSATPQTDTIKDPKQAIVENAVPKITKEGLIEKLTQLEAQASRPIQARKPTTIADVIQSVTETASGGREEAPGKRDFIGSLMGTLGKLGSYASSGQGLTLAGLATRNKGLLGSGLERLQKESEYEADAEEQNRKAIPEKLGIYKAIGDMSDIAPKGQYLEKFLYTAADGQTKIGILNKAADRIEDALITSPSDLVYKPESTYKFTHPVTGEIMAYSDLRGDSRTIAGGDTKWTPNQKKDLDQKGDAIRKSTAYELFSKNKSVSSSVKALLDIPNSTTAIKSMMVGAAGDVGNRAVFEQAGYATPESFVGSIMQKVQTAKDGRLTDESRKTILDQLAAFEKNGEKALDQDYKSQVASFLELNPKANPDAVKTYFDAVLNRSPSNKEIMEKPTKGSAKNAAPTAGGANKPTTGTPPVSQNKKFVIENGVKYRVLGSGRKAKVETE
jgi:hypothetical protein